MRTLTIIQQRENIGSGATSNTETTSHHVFNIILFSFTLFSLIWLLSFSLLLFVFSSFLFAHFLSSQTTLVTLLPLLGISPFFCPSIFDGGGCDSWGFRWWWQIVMVLAVVAVDRGGWVRKSSIFFFCFELSLSAFFSQTPQVNSFSHWLNQNFFILGWFLVVVGWVVGLFD